ncbi:adenylyl-sulfate kinase [Legionella israelensis]|uniref:Adenylyl-sulfate kinase n=1 Tax=Legionella israelensis TaxID=454 RepID=A0AAX1EGF6_9GAMM|nr:AAA family ATPase [Legionella israelensis]QBR84186.1 adenylyl-sulfate kinase [Legionella israelensis]
MTLIVLIAGASGSGKSCIAKELAKKLQETGIKTNFLKMDDYYKQRPVSIKSKEEISEYQKNTNFDAPHAMDMDLLQEHIKQLAQNKSIKKPLYSFIESDRLGEEEFSAQDVVIIEGIFALYDFGRLNLEENTLTVFVESVSYLSYQKQRTERDIKERCRTEEEVKKHELRFVREGFFKYVAPTRTYAEVIITNNYVINNPVSTKPSEDKNLQLQIDKLVETIGKRIQPESEHHDALPQSQF